MVGKFFGLGKKPEKLQPPSWAKSLHKVNAKDVITFLRDVPLFGVDYLLVIDGKITGRYNQQVSLGTLQVLTGNYLVYEVDVTEKVLNFTVDRVAFADPITTNINFDLAYRVVSAEDLFRANLNEIEPEIKRRVMRITKSICFEHASQDFHAARHKVEHQTLNLHLDFGVEIVSGLVEFHMPDSVMQAITRRGADVIVKDWVRSDIQFNEEVRFYGRDYPYQVIVRMGIKLDDSDPQAQQNLKDSGLVDPKPRAEIEAREAVRRVLRKYSSNIADAEEYAVRELKNMKLDFGARVDYASVEIIETETQNDDMREERFENELRKLLEEGWEAVLVRAAARPRFKDQIMDYIDSRRSMVEYEDAREQKLLAAQIDRIKTSIDIGVLDPELMDSNAQRALTSYLLGSKAGGAISGGQLGSGENRVSGQLPGKQADVVMRGQSDKAQDVSGIVPDKSSASDWDMDDD